MGPRLNERCGVMSGGMVLDWISDGTEAFHNLEILGMERAVIDQPRVLIEVNGLDNQRIAFPVPNCISQITRWESLPMRAAIRRDYVKEAAVHIVVEKHHFVSVLDDLGGRSNARHTGGLTLKHRVGLDLPVTQIFDFAQELGFVFRKVRGCRRGRCCGSTPAASPASGRIAGSWRCGRVRRTTQHTNGTVRQCLRSPECETPPMLPCSVQVRPRG